MLNNGMSFFYSFLLIIANTLKNQHQPCGQQSARGLLQRQHRTEHGQRKQTLSSYKPRNNSSLQKNSMADPGIKPGPPDQ